MKIIVYWLTIHYNVFTIGNESGNGLEPDRLQAIMRTNDG